MTHWKLLHLFCLLLKVKALAVDYSILEKS